MANKLNKPQKSFDELLKAYRIIIKESNLFKEFVDKLRPFIDQIDRIRCLAIGAIHDDFPARYQLAFLLEAHETIQKLKDEKVLVSIYDPVFTEEDILYIKKLGINWTIDEEHSIWNGNSDSTLFFLPHAPLNLTEIVLREECPKYWLANNIIQHTDRYTKQQLNDKYPLTSKLVNINLSIKNASKEAVLKKNTQNLDCFTTFTSKRKRRNNKLISKEPTIDYEAIKSYFNSCDIISTFENGSLLKEKPWNNSFSDLAFHIIV